MARTRHARVVRWDQPTYVTRNRARGIGLRRQLAEWRHRLDRERAASIARMHQVAAASASLRERWPSLGQAAQDKQETPGVDAPEASTDLEPLRKVPGGCSAECA